MELLPELLRAVKPRYAVISVGPNTFGHPHPDTLAALEEAGVKILRTDLHGSVIFRTDGSRLEVITMQEPVPTASKQNSFLKSKKGNMES
jgi:competence protein ComEC